MPEQVLASTRVAGLVDLAQPRLGSEVIYANDEFFGASSRLIDPRDPVFVPGKYDAHGKWMDGWETRRRREPGHDHCIIRLGVPGVVRSFDIDTSHFSGNHAPEMSIDACFSPTEDPVAATKWHGLLSRSPLQGDAHHYRAAGGDARLVTHLRVNIYPDGGVARVRAYGEVRPDWEALAGRDPLDLLAVAHGGRALACSDEHFGSMHNLNAPGRGANMGDGWETARRRGPGYDWVLLALGRPGIVQAVEIDTAHFKGNYPDRAAIQAARATDTEIESLVSASESWGVLLAERKLRPDRRQRFETELAALGPVSHVRLNIYPDGGVSRLRVFGRLAHDG